MIKLKIKIWDLKILKKNNRLANSNLYRYLLLITKELKL